MQEIDREAPRGEVTAEHLLRMPYVDACIKEALRLYPPAVLLGRQLGEDTTIKGHLLPKGTGVMVGNSHAALPFIIHISIEICLVP